MKLYERAPSEAVEVLEFRRFEPGFMDCHRAFLRACSVHLLDGAPDEARIWCEAADAFEAKRIGAAELDAMRVRAWGYVDASRDTRPLAETSRLRALLFRLWPKDDAERWYETVWHFVRFCGEAGVGEDVWWPLMCSSFEGFLSKGEG